MIRRGILAVAFLAVGVGVGVLLGGTPLSGQDGTACDAGASLLEGNVVVFNADQQSVDFNVRGTTNPNLIYANATGSNEGVGFGTNAPQARIHTKSGSAGGKYESASRMIVEADTHAIFSVLSSKEGYPEIYLGNGDGSPGGPGDTDRAWVGYSRNEDMLYIGSGNASGINIYATAGGVGGRVQIRGGGSPGTSLGIPDADLEVSDGATQGAGTIHAAAISAHSGSLSVGAMKYTGPNLTGGQAVWLGSNSPATGAVPYTWLQITTADGSIGYIPVWR